MERFSVQTALAVLLMGYVVSMYVERWITEKKIKKIGGISPLFRTYAPFGLDFSYRALQNFRRNRLADTWNDEFVALGCAERNSYTAELRVLRNIRVVFTADPENTKALLTTQFADYGKGEKFHNEWAPFMGDSIFTTDGQTWHDSRQLIRPMFMRERVADLDIFEEHIGPLVDLLGPGDGRQVDVRKIFFRFALDASTHYLFGHDAGSLVNEHAEFASAFDTVGRKQAEILQAGALRVFIPMKAYHEGLKTIDKFIEPWITEALNLTPEELSTKLQKSETFIHALARYTRDRKVIRDQLVGLLAAGRDTTSTVLSWIFYELSRHPRVVEKVHREIAEQVGPVGRCPTYQEIKDMKYLTAVINETLRLYPAVPFNVRTANKDTTLPRGAGEDGMQPVGILKGTAIGYSPLIMHRRRDLYPPISETFPYDPLEWAPERWETWQPKPWAFIPFNGGPRICIGQQFAMVEMAYVIVRVLQHFDRIVDYGHKVEEGFGILLSPYPGVTIGFVKDER